MPSFDMIGRVVATAQGGVAEKAIALGVILCLLPVWSQHLAGIKTFLFFIFSDVIRILQIVCVADIFSTFVVAYKNHVLIFLGDYLSSHAHD